MAVKWKNRMITDAFRTRGFSNGTPLATSGIEHKLVRTAQLVSSEGHPFQRLGRNQRKEDIGGPFTSQKVEVKLSEQCIPQRIATVNSAGARTRDYFILPLPHDDVKDALTYTTSRRDESPTRFRTWMNSANPLGVSSSELDALGAVAIDRMAPTNPVSDFSTTFAEFLSERQLFTVPGKAGSLPGEYLNYQFGIAPTVSYAQDLREAIVDQERILRQLARDSGRGVRREGVVWADREVFDDSPPEIEEFYPVYIGVGPSTQINTRGKVEIIRSVEKQAWFSGSFTYYLPEEGILRTVAELDHLYGVKFGVDTAWELLPFSWLVDYVSSAGAGIGNLSRFAMDGLIMNYGYIMCKSVTTTRYKWKGGIRNADGAMYDRVLFADVVKTTLQRKPASPWGFGLLPGDLSPRQWSILAALGMTFVSK